MGHSIRTNVNLRDCAVCKVSNTDFIIAAPYIPPVNSEFYDVICFNNLDLLYNTFKGSNLLIVGDLNSRVGTPSFKNQTLTYNTNPDTIVNSHGKKLLKWLDERPDVIILNGLKIAGKTFDSNFTYYRGKLRSQNDIALSNRVKIMNSFKILPKTVYSDHCPVTLSCNVSINPSLDILYKCSKGCFNDDHYDVNKRLRRPMKLSRMNISKAVDYLENYARELKAEMFHDTNNNTMSTKIADCLYDACRRSYEKCKTQTTEIVGNMLNCGSSNFKAIAEANMSTYTILVNAGERTENCAVYLENWKKYEELAVQVENSEINAAVNTSWKNCRKDGKALWEMIDWKGKAEVKADETANECEMLKYFTGIFQSTKTKTHPTVSTTFCDLESYDTYIPILDDIPSMLELLVAMKRLGKGVSLDGIPPSIVNILPMSMKEVILSMIQRVFFGQYPDEWTKQILHSLKKDGHTPSDPKLRGIAIAPLLCRLYDIIIDERFCSWYMPNSEQAGFRPKQGCSLQIFMLLLLIQYSSEKEKDLLVGFMDYEKAFDYANRANIISDLMKKGCGHNMVRAIAKMFTTSTYYPKVNPCSLGEGITTDYGVTQGRCSSGSLFSFYVSDMPSAFENTVTEDFMDPYNLAQLADDTAFFAENIGSLRMKFEAILSFSAEKCQIPNIKKTKYCHFTDTPSYEPLALSDNVSIGSVDDKGYKYLGMFFYPTKKISEILTRNMNKRVGAITKFYAWLDSNKNTPIEIKLLILDNCMFSTILYGVETWGDITCVEDQLNKIEMKALRAILRVKSGTTSDLVLHELRRCRIVVKVKDRQYKFFKKMKDLPEENAIVSKIMDLCRNSEMVAYYSKLRGNNSEKDISDRERRIKDSDASMCEYYSQFHFSEKCCIYSSFLDDHHRYIITRWRLSNHDLRIETGRRTRPYTERVDRKCTECKLLEDEFHVVFVCPLYNTARRKYQHLLASNSIAMFLNPCFENMRDTALFLHEIELIRNSPR